MSAGATYERLPRGSPNGGLARADGGGAPSPPDPDHLIARLSDEISWLEARLAAPPHEPPHDGPAA